LGELLMLLGNDSEFDLKDLQYTVSRDEGSVADTYAIVRSSTNTAIASLLTDGYRSTVQHSSLIAVS
jgi:hypothetical protein